MASLALGLNALCDLCEILGSDKALPGELHGDKLARENKKRKERKKIEKEIGNITIMHKIGDKTKLKLIFNFNYHHYNFPYVKLEMSARYLWCDEHFSF